MWLTLFCPLCNAEVKNLDKRKMWLCVKSEETMFYHRFALWKTLECEPCSECCLTHSAGVWRNTPIPCVHECLLYQCPLCVNPPQSSLTSVFLGKIKEAFDRDAELQNLLLDPFFSAAVQDCQVWGRQKKQVPLVDVILRYSTGCFNSGLVISSIVLWKKRHNVVIRCFHIILSVSNR